MTEFGNPLFAAEVVCCIAEAREPTPGELALVAARIRREAARPLFAWYASSTEPPIDAYVRAAGVALRGNVDPHPAAQAPRRA